MSDDAEFLRRVYLDLTGRIPSPRDVHDFLADTDPDKRRKLVDDLLDSPRHATHFANVWRALHDPRGGGECRGAVFQSGFEAWLKRETARQRAVRSTRQRITGHADRRRAAIAGIGVEHPEKPNPLAFFAVKDASPANLAATTTRLFLGIQIECAQCHDHPFASWSREQFWNQAAFFAGIERQGDGIFAPLSEKVERREIAIADTKKIAKAVFLDQKDPAVESEESVRASPSRTGSRRRTIPISPAPRSIVCGAS